MRGYLRWFSLPFLLVLALMLAACGGQTLAPSPTAGGSLAAPATPSETAMPTKPKLSSVEPTVETLASPTTSADTGVLHNQTAEGRFMLGSADAPVTIVDYSDFL
ncbi:MAG: thiol:disulfide interchange protein DsbA [Herpetosiphonaceae bacterium]|nr:MAG: thiol:disulfide interchange protein DsbA [Herpetosiphonaceae bacterium]